MYLLLRCSVPRSGVAQRLSKLNIAHPPIVKRLVNIDFTSDAAIAWTNENSDYNASLNAMSFTLPVGENYFMRSVKFYLDKVADPELKDRTRRFIYQEAVHAKEHNRANKLLLDVYPNGVVLERITKTLLSLSRRFQPRSTQLATTCALEHFTALLAHVLLSRQDEFLEQSDEVFASFWLWHAVEELEHKAVCFDVYEHVCGKGLLSYLKRVAVMLSVSVFFVASLALGFSFIRLKQRILRVGQRLKGTQGEPSGAGGSARLSVLLKGVELSKYFDYYRRSFHPNDTDSSALINKWKSKNADFGRTNDTSGASELMLPRDFDAQAYLLLNPDVARAGVDPAEHYLRHGYAEGRSYHPAVVAQAG